MSEKEVCFNINILCGFGIIECIKELFENVCSEIVLCVDILVFVV